MNDSSNDNKLEVHDEKTYNEYLKRKKTESKLSRKKTQKQQSPYNNIKNQIIEVSKIFKNKTESKFSERQIYYSIMKSIYRDEIEKILKQQINEKKIFEYIIKCLHDNRLRYKLN